MGRVTLPTARTALPRPESTLLWRTLSLTLRRRRATKRATSTHTMTTRIGGPLRISRICTQVVLMGDKQYDFMKYLHEKFPKAGKLLFYKSKKFGMTPAVDPNHGFVLPPPGKKFKK